MKKLLIIDDKPALSKLIVQFLSNKFDITTKEDGLEAIAWLQEGNIPDLIVTDLQMPNIDGFELIKTIIPKSLWIFIKLLTNIAVC